MQKFFYSKNGITLIALVITIIVMLVLAGVSINAIIGDNGIINKSMEASFKAEMAQYLEDTSAYVFSKEAQATECGSEMESVKSFVYAGNTENNQYSDLIWDIFDPIRDFWQNLTGESYINVPITKVTEIKTNEYLSHLAVIEGDLTWFDEEANQDTDIVKWCIDLGVKVFIKNHGYVNSVGNGFVVGTDGEYTSTINGVSIPSGVACCSPDLTGFNTSCTWYLEYPNVNSAPTYNKLIYKDAPNDWYDYGNKKWANVITTSKNGVSYWTWIPRYEYKLANNVVVDGETYDIQADLSSNDSIRFIDVTTTTASSGYAIPEAFTFDGKNLPGIWIAKYEISEPKWAIGFSATTTHESITVNSLTVSGVSESTDESENVTSQEVYIRILNGTSVVQTAGEKNAEGRIISGVSLPWNSNPTLSLNTNYTIEVTIPSKFGPEFDTILTKNVKTAAGTIEQLTAPDLSGFNKNKTYYVLQTFGEGGVEQLSISNQHIETEIVTIGDKTREVSSIYYNNSDCKDWYDYENKKWANIVTFSNDGKSAAYWTWVPRYEYIVDDVNKSIDVTFLPLGDNQSPDEGYKIPDAFKFGNVDLAGIWVSKYEVQDIAIPNGFTAKVINGGFMITNISYEGQNQKSGMPNKGKLKVYSGDNLVGENNDFVVGSSSITGLADGEYRVVFEIEYAYKGEKNTILTKTLEQKVTVKSSVTANAPDLSGFNKDTCFAYYLIYNNVNSSSATLGERVTFDSGTGQANNMPANWYDYTNKKWANILVSDGALTPGITINSTELNKSAYRDKNITIWVWVPRYEYRLNEDKSQYETLFVSGNSTTTSGPSDNKFKIPDAFKFGNVELTGIWVGKYEVSEP